MCTCAFSACVPLGHLACPWVGAQAPSLEKARSRVKQPPVLPTLCCRSPAGQFLAGAHFFVHLHLTVLVTELVQSQAGAHLAPEQWILILRETSVTLRRPLCNGGRSPVPFKDSPLVCGQESRQEAHSTRQCLTRPYVDRGGLT